MDRDGFEATLRRDGYVPAQEVTLAPDERRAPHTHDFAVRILVTRGALNLLREGREDRYAAGETFAMERLCPHAEATDAEGATYPIGKLL